MARAPTVKPAASSDDGYIDPSNIWLDAINVTIGRVEGQECVGGVRFTNVVVPKGAIITAAVITVKCNLADANAITFTMEGEDTDDAATFTTRANFVGRTKTTAAVDYVSPAWVLDTEYTLPDISTIIQEIVQRAGWASGNDIVIFFTRKSGTVAREFYSWDYGTHGDCAKLVIDYIDKMPFPTFRPGM